MEAQAEAQKEADGRPPSFWDPAPPMQVPQVIGAQLQEKQRAGVAKLTAETPARWRMSRTNRRLVKRVLDEMLFYYRHTGKESRAEGAMEDADDAESLKQRVADDAGPI